MGRDGGERHRTKAMQPWRKWFVKNRCIRVPSFGNVCGYRFVFLSSISLSEREGPG